MSGLGGIRHRSPDHRPSKYGIPVGSALIILAAVVWNITAIPVASGDPIYRWVSPSGVVSYGDQPPRGAHRVQALPPIPPAPPPAAIAPTKSGSTAKEETLSAASKAQAAIARLNLLAAINNYQSSLQSARIPPPRSAYIPGFIGPYFPYGPHRFRERRPQRYRRPAHPPSRQPSMVLLPPPAPSSAYSSPVLIP
ncbi:MAG: DUF4124 domain-containing protein [Acidithiobacillus sp.]